MEALVCAVIGAIVAMVFTWDEYLVFLFALLGAGVGAGMMVSRIMGGG